MAFSRHFHLPGGTVTKKLLLFSHWVAEDFNFFYFQTKKNKKKLERASSTVCRWNIGKYKFFENFLWKKLLVDKCFFGGKSAEISVDHIWFWYKKLLIEVVYPLFVAPGKSMGLFALAVKNDFARTKFSMRY